MRGWRNNLELILKIDQNGRYCAEDRFIYIFRKGKSTDGFEFHWSLLLRFSLTHWGRVTDLCAGNLTIIGSDNGLSPGRRQAII